MNSKDCPCKKKECERHGKCDACRAYHDGLKRERSVACEREHKKSIYTELLLAVACLTAMQGVLLGIKLIVFHYAEETFYSRSMVTLLSMLVILAAVLIYCRWKHYAFSAFPEKFSTTYIIATLTAVAFYAVTLFFVNTFTMQNALMLLYGSIVTPIFEELLFRGAIWNRLNQYFDREWKTYLTVTVLFALWHIGYAVGLFLWNGGSLWNVIAMKVLVGAVFGAITGALRHKTKNCYLGILVHGVLNAL